MQGSTLQARNWEKEKAHEWNTRNKAKMHEKLGASLWAKLPHKMVSCASLSQEGESAVRFSDSTAVTTWWFHAPPFFFFFQEFHAKASQIRSIQRSLESRHTVTASTVHFGKGLMVKKLFSVVQLRVYSYLSNVSELSWQHLNELSSYIQSYRKIAWQHAG